MLLVGVLFVTMYFMRISHLEKIPQKHREQINAIDGALTENLHFS